MCALALSLLMNDDAHSLHVLATINAWYRNIGANCFMTFDIFSNTLSLAMPVSLTLYRGEFARVVMSCYFLILENLRATHRMVPALELHLL